MKYLKKFSLPTFQSESLYDFPTKYPFSLFSSKDFYEVYFSDVTIFYGSNGSGKSTLLDCLVGVNKYENAREASNEVSFLLGKSEMKETIIFRSTPKSCKECKYYDARRKCCTLKRCSYPARR